MLNFEGYAVKFYSINKLSQVILIYFLSNKLKNQFDSNIDIYFSFNIHLLIVNKFRYIMRKLILFYKFIQI